MKSKGFTLIELLVVIAIIGLLSSVVLASLNTARAKGMDAARKSNVKSLETALQTYYLDNGTYPKDGTSDNGYNISTLSTYLVPTYISSIFTDPISGTSDYYVWDNGGQSYGLLIYTSAATLNSGYPGYCLTGVNQNLGWWSVPAPAVPACNF